MKRLTESGFSIAEIILGVVILAAIIFVGINVAKSQSGNNTGSTATTSVTAPQSNSVATPAAPQINNASDLNSALQALNNTSISASSSDSSQLSAEASAF